MNLQSGPQPRLGNDKPFTANRHPTPTPSPSIDDLNVEDEYSEMCDMIIGAIGIFAIAIVSILVWWACGDDIKLIFK